MKRTFWSTVLMAITITGGWTLYVGAQELQNQIGFSSETNAISPRFLFVEHFFLNQGQPFEIFLRLDRHTGQTWRYHATQSGWALIRESSNGTPEADSHDRYELLSHVFRNAQGIQLERMLRVDYESGRSWMYETTAGEWVELEIEVVPSTDERDANQTAQVTEQD